MTLLHILVLSIVQGITEFLPISSSGHLILVPALTGWPDQGLVIDVAAHVGTLGAVVVYFWRDLAAMLAGLMRLSLGRGGPESQLAGQLIVATVPVVIAGAAASVWLGDSLRSVEVIGWTMFGFGVLLYVADRIGVTLRRIEHLSYRDAAIIGLAQVLALIPGTSRAGITMTAARLLGFERVDAARFSMLLSIPTIIAAGALGGYELYTSGTSPVSSAAVAVAGLSFVFALIAIAVLMRWLRRATFTPLVVYRLILGLGLLGWAYY